MLIFYEAGGELSLDQPRLRRGSRRKDEVATLAEAREQTIEV
jgi:hypothetical protein